MRYLSFLALILIGSSGQETGPLSKKALLSKSKPKKPLVRRYLLPKGAEPAKDPDSRLGTIGRAQVFFLDMDGNGKFDDLGTDAWCIAGQKHALPLDRAIVLGTDEAELKVAEDGSAVNYSIKPAKAKKEYLDALVLLNDLRLKAGLPPAGFDAKLSDACEKHSAYMDKNGITHDEVQGRAGYTPEGAEAGKKSCCVTTGRSAEGAQVFYDSFYHRMPLMSPDTTAYGIGSSPGHTSIDGISSRKKRAWQYPILIPAPDSDGNPVNFTSFGEMPQPYPSGFTAGFPITAMFHFATPSDAKAELREGGPKGKPVEILVSAPDRPANSQRPENDWVICLIPKGPLRPKTAYSVQITYQLNGTTEELKWSFSTK